MAKKAPKDKSLPEAELFGFKIKDKCRCGDKVQPYERQELFLDTVNNVWLRLCGNCITESKKPESHKIKAKKEAA